MPGASPDVRVGTCGIRGRQAEAFAELDIVEIQRTFYQPPKLATAERWRARAPRDFRFALKAWQLLTHRRASPTYRRLTERLSEAELDAAGALRWNELTRAAWERTRAIAGALDAEAVVFQTPRSFRPTDANLERVRTFFREAPRDGYWMVFEPRGEAWSDDLLAPLCAELDLVHGVDPFLRDPVGAGPRYYRLHGRPAYHYRYAYSDAELDEIAAAMPAGVPVRVLFNNDHMAEDAGRLRRRLGRPA